MQLPPNFYGDIKTAADWRARQATNTTARNAAARQPDPRVMSGGLQAASSTYHDLNSGTMYGYGGGTAQSPGWTGGLSDFTNGITNRSNDESSSFTNDINPINWSGYYPGGVSGSTVPSTNFDITQLSNASNVPNANDMGPGGSVMTPTFQNSPEGGIRTPVFNLPGAGGNAFGNGGGGGGGVPNSGGLAGLLGLGSNFGGQGPVVMGGSGGIGGGISGTGGSQYDPVIVRQLLEDFKNKQATAKGANESRYQDIIGLLNDRYNRGIGNLQGSGDQAVADVNRAYDRQKAEQDQSLIDRGMMGSTVRSDVQRGVEEDRQSAINRVNESIRRERLGTDATLSKDTIDAMERRTDEYPSDEMLMQLSLLLGQSGMGPGGSGTGAGGAGAGGAGIPNAASYLGPSKTTQGPGYTQTQTLVPPSNWTTGASFSQPKTWEYYAQAQNNPADYGYGSPSSGGGQSIPAWIAAPGGGLMRNPAYDQMYGAVR